MSGFGGARPAVSGIRRDRPLGRSGRRIDVVVRQQDPPRTQARDERVHLGTPRPDGVPGSRHGGSHWG